MLAAVALATWHQCPAPGRDGVAERGALFSSGMYRYLQLVWVYGTLLHKTILHPVHIPGRAAAGAAPDTPQMVEKGREHELTCSEAIGGLPDLGPSSGQSVPSPPLPPHLLWALAGGLGAVAVSAAAQSPAASWEPWAPGWGGAGAHPAPRRAVRPHGALACIFSRQLAQNASSRLSRLAQKSVKSLSSRSANFSSPVALERHVLVSMVL